MQRILCSTAVLALLMGAGTALAQNNTTTPAVDCSVAANANTDACKDQSAKQSTGQNGAATGTDNNAAQTTVPKSTNDTAAQTDQNSSGNSDTMATGTTSAPSTDQNNTTAASAPGNGGSTAGVPAGTQFLASQFIGKTVYSSANENVGDINDLVMNKDLDTVVAIIGVGGFLGIGEKDVAIPVDQITITTDNNATASNTTGTGTTTATGTTANDATSNTVGAVAPKLVINMTREQLEAAPAFDRTALAR